MHIECFVAKEFDNRADVPFEMEYVDSGVTLTIPVGKSNQEVVEAEGLSVISSCGEGTCRICETVVVAGEMERRDSILTDEEKAACDSMFICVSLSKDDCSL